VPLCQASWPLPTGSPRQCEAATGRAADAAASTTNGERCRVDVYAASALATSDAAVFSARAQ
jgi:hypothetical protein